MIKLNDYLNEREIIHEVLPPTHPFMWGQPQNQPEYEQDYQWRLKVQPFTNGGFEVRTVLVNRNHLNRLVNANRLGGRRRTPKDKDEDEKLRDLKKCAYRASRKVRHLCLEIGADRLLTLTSRQLLTDYDQTTATWKRFLRVLEGVDVTLMYVAVPELHKNGEHFHIHAAINSHVRVEILRRCWQIALGGKGDERGQEALGNVDMKSSIRRGQSKSKQAVGVAKYISKYITKGYLEHHRFNRKRYWAPRSIKLPEASGEWMQAEYLVQVIEELKLRFDSAIIIQAMNDNSIYINESNTPLLFFRYMPDEDNPLPVPF